MLQVIRQKSDIIGAAASALCMVHCIATPFLFLASACTKSCCSAAPTWWIWLDFVFLGISFMAVYKSLQTTTKYWLKPALWSAWGTLFTFIFIEQFGSFHLNEGFKYTAALSLIGLHLYNLRYCQCKDDNCCA